MTMQMEEELAVLESRGEKVRGSHGEGGLSDPRHPVNRMNANDPGVRVCRVQDLLNPFQLGTAPSEGRNVPGQTERRSRPGRHREFSDLQPEHFEPAHDFGRIEGADQLGQFPSGGILAQAGDDSFGDLFDEFRRLHVHHFAEGAAGRIGDPLLQFDHLAGYSGRQGVPHGSRTAEAQFWWCGEVAGESALQHRPNGWVRLGHDRPQGAVHGLLERSLVVLTSDQPDAGVTAESHQPAHNSAYDIDRHHRDAALPPTLTRRRSRTAVATDQAVPD